MPNYFTLNLMFSRKRITPDFIANTHQRIIDSGFSFLGEHRWYDDDNENDFRKCVIDTPFPELNAWNQAYLEKRLRLGFPKVDDVIYKHILFQRDGYSELRGIWHDFGGSLHFNLITPEDDILSHTEVQETGEEKQARFNEAAEMSARISAARGRKITIHAEETIRKSSFIPEKLEPFIDLAQTFWNNGMVDAVQTEDEWIDPVYSLSDVIKGRGVWFCPFAIIPEVAFARFPEGHFANTRIEKITNNGIYINKNNAEV